MAEAFEQAVTVLPARIRAALLSLPEKTRAQVREVRMYAASPIRLTMQTGTLFPSVNGSVSRILSEQAMRVSQDEIGETVLRACGYSLHSVEQELREGFLTLPGGHRLAVCGKIIVKQSSDTQPLEEITSLNLRIARFMPDAARDLCRTIFCGGLCSPILAGPPMSGKTTLLRSLAHNLSIGRCGDVYRVSVLDTRREFSPLPYCDVLCGGDKATGIERALRLLSPQIIICDEIADPQEIEALKRGFSAGCACAVSVHVGSRAEFCARAPLQALLQTGQFTHVVLLDAETPGRVQEVYSPQELCA